jgi:hypothetical protein
VEIKNFLRIRVGSGYPACLDIESIGNHESYGIYAISTLPWTSDLHHEGGYVQLRQLEDGTVALFAFRFADMAVPASWSEACILWDSRNEGKEKQEVAA